jgi:hypothetical protein
MEYLSRKMHDIEEHRSHKRHDDEAHKYHRGRYYGEYEQGRHYDDDDYEEYEEHREHMPKLTRDDAKRWKKMMENFDGTHGEHYSREQTEQAAEKLDISFDDFSEMEFCLAVNMIYSDYGHILHKYVSPDKELHACAELAKAFLEDPDGPGPSVKLALYYHCIVNADV